MGPTAQKNVMFREPYDAVIFVMKDTYAAVNLASKAGFGVGSPL